MTASNILLFAATELVLCFRLIALIVTWSPADAADGWNGWRAGC